MDRVITEIIVGVVILVLVIAVIPIYRNSSELVISAAESRDFNENIREVTIGKLPNIHDIVSGRYLFELLEYYSAKGSAISVSIDFPAGIYQFTGTASQKDREVIGSDMLFELQQIHEDDTDSYRMQFIYQETAQDLVSD